MGKSQITFNKKERTKKKQLKKKEKLERREFSKENNDKGKSFEEMFAYVDEHGNLSDTPPEKKYEFKEEDLVRPGDGEDEFMHGKVSYYNEEGRYGFIRDNVTRQTVYFNDRLAGISLKVEQRVQYKSVRTKQGEQISEVKLEA
ncbi:cold shock domain-containing protein [Sphingobacterium sp. UT-1RO-CII-1]|uniref:cold shock domain-containing protein n=1 Tax=Sphingobacterium sp. UT-1RO-CII-1 TaxID=2995225 RepID=UPI00227B7B35|nr:cold shock domain-containing protein [Sphingobacterium sp. UT-1RO-CII-1]MCY4779333.1 cold shock domain-containing protein [Sphingobacterium sp. UT-1RO-CII-1]